MKRFVSFLITRIVFQLFAQELNMQKESEKKEHRKYLYEMDF